MRGKQFIFFLFLLVTSFFKVSAQSIDSVVQYTYLKSSLNENSRFFDSGRYAYYLPIRMRKGDFLYFLYESRDYVGAVYVRDSTLKNGILKHDDSSLFVPMGSKLKMSFKAASNGIYYFILTTKEVRTLGKFGIHLFYFNSKKVTCTNTSSFAEKLNYIAQNGNTGFEFLKAKGGRDAMGVYFLPSINLLTDGYNQIVSEPTETYLANYPSFKSLKEATNKFNDLALMIVEALPEHQSSEAR
jgi:hypothetical protein